MSLKGSGRWSVVGGQFFVTPFAWGVGIWGELLFCPGRGAGDGDGNIFEPRRATEVHGEGQLQRQHLFVHEGPLRGTKNGNCNGNTFCPRRATEGHGELQRQHLFVHGGRGGVRGSDIYV